MELLSLADKTKNDFLYREENLEGTITIGSGEFLSTSVQVVDAAHAKIHLCIGCISCGYFKQKQLDRLDYLRYEIARQKQNDK